MGNGQSSWARRYKVIDHSQPKPTIRADAPPCMDTASGALRELHLLTPIFEAEYAAVPLAG